MFFNSALILAAFVSAVSASDVYSTFYGNTGGAITPNFDIANDGCFELDNAAEVSFSQAGPGTHFNGPYCLSAWTDSGCPGTASATQQYEGLNQGTKYQLNQGLIDQGSFKWSAKGC